MTCYWLIGLLFVATSSTTLPQNSGKIVGGHQANPHQFPYNIQLQWWGNHLCGAAIISPEWVITAAHCAIQEAISYTVVANQHNLLVPEEERRYLVSKVIQHPNFTASVYHNDIALLKVNRPIEFDEIVQPVALPPAYHTPPVGSLVTITGWGAIAEDGLSSAYLRWVDIPTISDDVCRESYGFSKILDSMICAGFIEGGQDSCSGDSGGPAVGQDLGYQYLVGIVSWGRGCAQPGFPGVNTDVAYYIDWIEKTMEEN